MPAMCSISKSCVKSWLSIKKISNFDPVRMLDIRTFAQEQPVLNQVETHVRWQQKPAHH